MNNKIYGQNDKQNQQRDPMQDYGPLGKQTPSSTVKFFSFIAIILLVVGFAIYIAKSYDTMFLNASMTLYTLKNIALLGAGIIFFLFYFVCYQDGTWEALVPATFSLLSATGVIGIINLFSAIIETNTIGYDGGKRFMSFLPNFVVPTLSAILFILVAKSFINKNFSKTLYTMALGFVLAYCPQTIIEYISKFATITGDNSVLIHGIFIAIGEAFLYIALIVFGVSNCYNKVE